MNVSTGVNQSAGRSQTRSPVKLPISADCVADRHSPPILHVVDEVL